MAPWWPGWRSGPPDVAIRKSIAALFGASTDAVVTVRVENHGNVVLTPVAHVELTGAFGTGANRTFSVGPLLPGESVTRHYTVSVRAVGEVQAQVSVAAKGTHSDRGDVAVGRALGPGGDGRRDPGSGGVNAGALAPTSAPGPGSPRVRRRADESPVSAGWSGGGRGISGGRRGWSGGSVRRPSR